MSEASSCDDSEKSSEIQRLKELLSEKDREIELLKKAFEKRAQGNLDEGVEKSTPSEPSDFIHNPGKLIGRYSRQIILPEIGLEGQQHLASSSALIVGAGGLGCPAALYLAACGIGKLGIVDYDRVEISNLHRQVLHTEESVGTPKCQSFVTSVKKLNSQVDCVKYEVLLNSSNVADIVKPYTVVVDCSDNVPTRYLLNDSCVFSGKPLVSGAALRFEGQLTVYNCDGGPCYRCLFPLLPSAGTTTNCSDGGILGVVTGVIGCLQALEVVKLCTGLSPSYSGKLLLFDGLSGLFRIVKLRGKAHCCQVCGENPTIKHFVDYESFCQASAKDKTDNINLLSHHERISCSDYKKLLDENVPHLLLDVRPKNEVNICKLPCSVNIPLSELNCEENLKWVKELIKEEGTKQHYVICRRGNSSQKAVRLLKENSADESVIWQDVKGGLVAWHGEVDLCFPVY